MSKEILHRNGAAIVAEPVSGWIPQRAEFDADLNLVAAVAGERLADQHFIVAHAIEIAGVEQPASSAAWMVAMLSPRSAGP
jgi:hypothetical protein